MTAITLATHRALGWRPAQGYGFTRSMSTQGISVAEIPRCAQTMPVAFRKIDETWTPVAVLGSGTNLYVDEAGRWLGGYVPVAFRFYPFLFQDKKLFLWPGFETEPTDVEGVQPIFNGIELADRVKQTAAVLTRTAQENEKAQPVFALLERCEVLKPWSPPQFQATDIDPAVKNLFQVDWKAFDGLGDYDWLRLRRFRAHSWIYAHLESLRLAERFAAISAVGASSAIPARAHPSQQQRDTADIDGFFAALSRDVEVL